MRSGIKYSIVMPYHNRAQQLRNTFDSFCRFYSNRNDFEVLLIEDMKDHTSPQLHEAFEGVYQEFKDRIRVHVLEEVFNSLSPVLALNYGVSQARGSFIILTNPECLHEVNILAGLDEEFTKNEDCYVVCACRAVKADGRFDMWYQHSLHRNVCLHFCTAISRVLFKLLQGFPTEFDGGYCFDDDAFRERVKEAGIPFVLRDDLLVTHQWHSKERPRNWPALWERNKMIYKRMFSK